MIYKSVLNRFQWTKYSLYVYFASLFLLVILNCLELNLYNNDGLVFYDGEVLYKEDHAWRLLGLSGFSAIVSLITLVITFLMWIHRAYSNLPFLGNVNPKTTPGWAVGWWFIPIAFLFKPFSVMKEIYIWSGADGAKISTNILGLWWTFWICSHILQQITFRLPSTNLEEYSVIIVIDLIYYIVEIFAGILFLKILTSITYSQEIKSEIKSTNI
tara:strand:+ start:56 stop:697 length:642 start_codon:yes stop_codon:yes gene_type:complete